MTTLFFSQKQQIGKPQQSRWLSGTGIANVALKMISASRPTCRTYSSVNKQVVNIMASPLLCASLATNWSRISATSPSEVWIKCPLRFLWMCRNIRFRLQQPPPLPRRSQAAFLRRARPLSASQLEVCLDNISVTSAAIKARAKQSENPAVCGQTLTRVPCCDTVTVANDIFMQ